MTGETAIGAVTAFDPERFPRRVNLGCGWDRRDGYLNVDLHAFHEPDLVADVRDLGVLPTAAYDEVLAQDVLEHLHRTDALPALREWARILRPGATLVLRVPDLVGLLGLLAARRSRAEQEELVQCLFGTQAYDGDYHQGGFTEVLLRHYLHDAGFHDVRIEHRDEWLFDVVARRAAGPVVLDLGDLPFMAPPVQSALSSLAAGAVTAAAVLPDIEARLAAIAEHVRAAEATADIETLDIAARWRAPKRVVHRVGRVVIHRQTAHNRAVAAALRGIVEILDRRAR